MQDLLDQLINLGYSASMVSQIRPQIKRCARVYNAPLDRITIDPQDFEKRFGTGRVSSAALGFKSRDQFVDWRRRVRAAINKVAESETSENLLSETWTSLHDQVETATRTKLIGPFAQSSVKALGASATRLGVEPNGLTAEIIDRAYAGLKDRNREVFKRGLGILNKIIAAPEKFPEMARLLPANALPAPARTRRPDSPFRRGEPGTDRLWAEFDNVIADKLETTQLKESTINDYAKGVRVASSALLEIGYFRTGQELGLWDVCNPAALVEYANFYRDGIERGQYKENATSLPVRIRKLCHLGIQVARSENDVSKLKKLKLKVEKACPANTKEMAPDRLKWIINFARSPAQQRAVHTMPEKLMRQADKVLANWHDLKVANKRKKQMEALFLGQAAVIAAILFRASPMRATNLRYLTIYGSDASITHDNSFNNIRFHVDAGKVKNSAAIDAEADSEVGHVLRWYLKEIRPRLIHEHPYSGLVDSDYLFPSRSPDKPACAATMAEHFIRGCNAAGIDMTLHQARHICGFLILLMKPSAIGAVAALLNISEEVARRYYAWIDDRKSAAMARDCLKRSREDARAHKHGTFLAQ